MKLMTQPSCPHCHAVKERFDSLGLRYEEVDLMSGTPDAKKALLIARAHHIRTTPFASYDLYGYVNTLTYEDLESMDDGELIRIASL